MRTFATLALAAGLSLAAAAPAAADWPDGQCLVRAGGTMWNACVINPFPVVEPILP